MSIFSDVVEFLKPLDDVKDDFVEFIGEDNIGLLGKGAKGIARVGRNAKEKAAEANKLLREDLMSVNQSYTPGKAEFGLGNYAPDPMATERMWQSILTQFLTPNATKGGK